MKQKEKIQLPAWCLAKKYAQDINYDEVDRADDTKYVYVLRNPLSRLSKIGITNDHNTRYAQLVNACGMILQDLLVLELEQDYDESAKYIEKYLHQYFASKRTYGEWFDLSVRDILAIHELFYNIEGCDIIDYVRHYLSKAP